MVILIVSVWKWGGSYFEKVRAPFLDGERWADNRVINGGSNGSVSAAHDSELTARLGSASNGSGWRVTFTTSDTTHTNTLRFYIPIQSSLSPPLSPTAIPSSWFCCFVEGKQSDAHTESEHRWKYKQNKIQFSLFIIIIIGDTIIIIWGTMSHQTGSVLLLERDKQKKKKKFCCHQTLQVVCCRVVYSLWTWLWHCRGTVASDKTCPV